MLLFEAVQRLEHDSQVGSGGDQGRHLCARVCQTLYLQVRQLAIELIGHVEICCSEGQTELHRGTPLSGLGPEVAAIFNPWLWLNTH